MRGGRGNGERREGGWKKKTKGSGGAGEGVEEIRKMGYGEMERVDMCGGKKKNGGKKDEKKEK